VYLQQRGAGQVSRAYCDSLYSIAWGKVYRQKVGHFPMYLC